MQAVHQRGVGLLAPCQDGPRRLPGREAGIFVHLP
ncbi:hypothetical protein E2C01_065906 [Portunus trituberculatus]|uniref:Uncharacterized protein n=1 Tax=Portunus trituberculatus TaxID=210409 RepID=A0A5B7HK40_PORTR|nr:hypothetical protein [Portunus trituberculatus]